MDKLITLPKTFCANPLRSLQGLGFWQTGTQRRQQAIPPQQREQKRGVEEIRRSPSGKRSRGIK
jgi:hypothetical protein